MEVPDEVPERCPACGDAYESVSRHAGGFTVNLLDNERYARVCFHPVEHDDEPTLDGAPELGESPALDCYHHRHADGDDREIT